METPKLWKLAAAPNYTMNVNKYFPYSETPYLGEYNLVKIPLPDKTIDHVDYWGEGRVQGKDGARGFNDAYNVNLTYWLVSEGPDKNKRVPNRIPVHSYTNSDTSAYVKDNSVLIVTLDSTDSAYVTHSCIADITRIVNKDKGIVVAFGFKSDSKVATDLTTALKNKSLYPCPEYKLPIDLQGTQFQEYVAFLNIDAIKTELTNFVKSGSYTSAVAISKSLDNHKKGEEVRKVVESLLAYKPNGRNLVSFAYQLWQNNGQDIVRNHFPESLKLIVSGANVIILNKKFDQALKLDASTDSYGDRLVWGDSNEKASKRVSWKFVPVWENNAVTFKLLNGDYNMYMFLDATADDAGDRKAWGSSGSDNDRSRFYVEPFLWFFNAFQMYLVNYKYGQSLKLDATSDSAGDRLVWGNSGDYNSEERFEWTVQEWV